MITVSQKLYEIMPEDIKKCFKELPNESKEEVRAVFPDTVSGRMGIKTRNNIGFHSDNTIYGNGAGTYDCPEYGDSGSASRFFKSCPFDDEDAEAQRLIYVAKASKQDRNEGCEDLEAKIKDEDYRQPTGNAMVDRIHGCGKKSQNNHPTIKPFRLMAYLCKLITPPAGIVLDPFMGSGSTGKGAVEEGFRFIGIEQDAEYIEIARHRLSQATEQGKLF